MSSGGSQGSNTTSEPWANIKDPMINTINQAASYYGTPYQGYTGQTVAGPSDTTDAYYQAAYQRGTRGAPDINSARGMATDMTNGAYLGSNPYVQQNSDYTKQVMADNASNMANAFASGTAAQNDAMFARSGAYGGSAWQQKQSSDAANLAKEVGQMGNQYNMQRSQLGASDYQSGLNNMLQAGQLAGTLSQDDYNSLNMLKSVGSDQSAYQQKLLDSAKSEWSNQMQYPEYALKSMGNLLSQFSGYGTQATTSPYSTSPWTNAIGGLTAATGLLGAMK